MRGPTNALNILVRPQQPRSSFIHTFPFSGVMSEAYGCSRFQSTPSVNNVWLQRTGGNECRGYLSSLHLLVLPV